MNETNSQKYDDILKLPHPVSKKHPGMPLSDRAAQFSPFAALTGHDAAVRETARLTEEFAELDEDKKTEIDACLRIIKENLSQKPQIDVVYFKPDKRKRGGAYLTFSGTVKVINETNKSILFEDGTVINFDCLFSVRYKCDAFNDNL